MKRSLRLMILLLTVLFSLACVMPNITISMPTGENPQSLPDAQSPVGVTQSAVPEQPAGMEPTLTITASPNVPAAVAVNEFNSGVVRLYSLNGQLITAIDAPGLEYGGTHTVHLAGRLSDASIPLAYQVYANDGQILGSNSGQVTTLANVPDFVGMAGAAGGSSLAYSTAEYGQNSLLTKLFFGDINTLASSRLLLSLEDPTYRAIKPLGIHLQAGIPVGVWYTMLPYGIGGDFVFEPTEGLYHVDINTGTVTDHSNNVSNSPALSIDQTWVANGRGAPGNGTFHIYNLLSGENIGFNPNAASERGAGCGVFSPAHQYVAWMEGSGWTMSETPNFHSTVRVGTIRGEWLADYPDIMFADSLGTPVTRAEPAGWLDENRLLVQIHGVEWYETTLAVVDTASGAITFFAPGVFLGFVYP